MAANGRVSKTRRATSAGWTPACDQPGGELSTSGVVGSNLNDPVSVASADVEAGGDVAVELHAEPVEQAGRDDRRRGRGRVDQADAPEARVGRVVVHHDPIRCRRQRWRSSPEPARARRVETDRQVGDVGRRRRVHEQIQPGQEAERLGQLERLREGGLHLGEPEPAQPEPEPEHAAQRVAVRVDMAHQQHGRVPVEPGDGLGRAGQLSVECGLFRGSPPSAVTDARSSRQVPVDDPGPSSVSSSVATRYGWASPA